LIPLKANLPISRFKGNNITIDFSLSENIRSRKLLLKLFIKSIVNKKIYVEVKKFKKNPYLLIKAFWRTLKFEILSEIVRQWLIQVNMIDGNKISNQRVFYSFWINAVIYGLAKFSLTSDIKIICRGNGYDVFEYTHKPAFFPFREFYLKHVDLILCASLEAMTHLIKNYPRLKSKIILSHLGIKNLKAIEYKTKKNNERFIIVSCSSISDVKRVEKLALSLSLIKNLNYDWYHLGTGPRLILLQIIKILKKRNNQNWFFLGQVPNIKINDIYQKLSPHLFINFSSTEGGVPVSIMEAARTGIPVLASDVGGIPEIVKHLKTGVLVNSGASAKLISTQIEGLANSPDLLENFSAAIRSEFENNFQSSNNYLKFIHQLKMHNII
jgi:colanic acid/amylovoran biosynthesis glycosyltransferase